MNKGQLETPVVSSSKSHLPGGHERSFLLLICFSCLAPSLQDLLSLLLAHTSGSCSWPAKDTTQPPPLIPLPQSLPGRWWRPLPSISSLWLTLPGT